MNRAGGLLVVAIIGALAVPGIAIGVYLKRRETERTLASAARGARRDGDERSAVGRRAPPPEGDAGDRALGRTLFEVHCFSCHGLRADGRGPSAESFRPRPRALADPAYLASVGDDRLARAVLEGGPSVGRSRLMPSFAERFDALDVAAIVAYLRSLSLSVRDVVPAEAGDSVLGRETVLDDGRAVAFSEIARADGAVRARVLFEGDAAIAALPDGSRLAATTIHGSPPPPATEARLLALLAAGVARRDADVAFAASVRARLRDDPASLSRGARLFGEACAACHGPAGRPVELEPAQTTHRPALLADASRVSGLSDDDLLELLRRGGGPMRISEAMPSFGGAYSEEDLREIVRHVRSLAVPRRDPPPPETRTP